MAQDDNSSAPVGGGGNISVPAPKSKLKFIVLVVLTLAVGLGGGWLAAKMLVKPPASEVGPAAVKDAPSPEAGGSNLPPLTPPRKEEYGPAPVKTASGGGAGEETDSTFSESPAGLTIVELKPFVVNLSSPSGRRDFLKVTISLDAGTPALAAEIEAKLPVIRDMILLLLSSQTLEDIKGMDGKTRLRSQIMSRVNDVLTSGRVHNIYFSEFVVN